MDIRKRIKDLLFKEEWTLAIRKRQDKLLFEPGGTDKQFFIIKNSPRYWAADPFLISKDDKDYIFFEMYDRLKGKGLIGYRVIEDGKISKMRVAYEHNTHLSFPFIFEYKGDFYMMPESSEESTLMLLRAKKFPNEWEKISYLSQGERMVDSSLYEHNEEVFLFTQQIRKGYSFDSLDIFMLKSNELVPHKKNPVVVSAENSRPAGKVFDHNSRIIRVSQDCSNGYGTKIKFNEILCLTNEDYLEETFRDIETSDLLLDKKIDFCGVHTYNLNERYEIIDIKNKNQIRLFNILNIIYRAVCKVFAKY